MLEEIKEDINKWKVTNVHGLEDLILLRCQYYPVIYTLNAIPINNPMTFFFR